MTSTTFRSLGVYNYRTWAIGALVANMGTWMERTAQDWLVLTELTDNSAVAVGTVMALQFGPPIVLLPITGYVADHIDHRKILLVTKSVIGVLALLLGLLTISGTVELWQVYIFAGLLGCTTAFDSPARQVFVSALVNRENLANAVALNSASFNMARMMGPGMAGLLIAVVGTGWVFVIAAGALAGVIVALVLLRTEELHRDKRARKGSGGIVEGFRYVWRRPDILVVLVIIAVFGTFALNFPIYIATMATEVFHKGAGEYGLLSSVMAIGSLGGSLLAARRAHPRVSLLMAAGAMFGIGGTLAALMPGYWSFAAMLILVGLAAQTLTTSANSVVQLSTDPEIRGRVMAIYVGIIMGGTPLGAPIVGWVADTYGARWGLGVGAAAGFVCALIGVVYFVKYRNLRVHYRRWRPYLTYGDREEAITELATSEIEIQRGGSV